jgi:hypothetical protein
MNGMVSCIVCIASGGIEAVMGIAAGVPSTSGVRTPPKALTYNISSNTAADWTGYYY